MSHDEWNKRHRQNIRETAFKLSKDLHISNMESANNNHDLDEENTHFQTVFVESVLEDAEKIKEFIKEGEHLYKD